MNCPCNSGKLYEDCCQPFHQYNQQAPTAEALMRSRFSAFAIPNGDYLVETTLPSKRKLHNIDNLQEWGEINQWTGLKIVNKPSLNQVEFKALYTDEKDQPQIHHELSKFEKVKERWYYVSGKFFD